MPHLLLPCQCVPWSAPLLWPPPSHSSERWLQMSASPLRPRTCFHSSAQVAAPSSCPNRGWEAGSACTLACLTHVTPGKGDNYIKLLVRLITTASTPMQEAENESISPLWTGLNGSVILMQFYNLPLPFELLYKREDMHLLIWENLSHWTMASSSYPSGTHSPTVQNPVSDWTGKFYFHSHTDMANNSDITASTGFQREVILVPLDWEMVLFWRKKMKIFHQENAATDIFWTTCPQPKWVPAKAKDTSVFIPVRQEVDLYCMLLKIPLFLAFSFSEVRGLNRMGKLRV